MMNKLTHFVTWLSIYYMFDIFIDAEDKMANMIDNTLASMV